MSTPVRKDLLKFWGIIRTPKPPLGLKSACTAPLQIYNMVLRAFLWLKVFCSFLCCVSWGKKRKERKKSIYCVLGSSYLLSTTEQEQRRERRGMSKELIWQRPIDFHFLLHQITAKKKKCFSQTVLMGCQLSKCVC